MGSIMIKFYPVESQGAATVSSIEAKKIHHLRVPHQRLTRPGNQNVGPVGMGYLVTDHSIDCAFSQLRRASPGVILRVFIELQRVTLQEAPQSSNEVAGRFSQNPCVECCIAR